MELTKEERILCDKAVLHVKEHSKDVVEEYANLETVPPSSRPVSVFMAGSPGAGKTEFSEELVDLIWKGDVHRVVRIDPDRVRMSLPGYLGGNAYVFQKAVAIAVHKIHHAVLKNKQNFILDGTLSNYDIAHENITRSLKRGRQVYIFFVYQNPEVAWTFTQKREEEEGRRIELETFVQQFFTAQETVNALKKEFGKDVKVSFVEKNLEREMVQFRANVDRVDSYIKNTYTDKNVLKEALAKL